MTDPVRSRASNGGATDTLYNLLPAVYRLRDAAEGEPLRALLAVAEAEFDLLKADIQGLYGNWFVETCDEWVVPYIGDLLGVRGMQPVGSGKQFSQRGFVANTLAYRRRKGTVAVLEQLGRDITGWPAKAVEFFSRLITTQNINHVRRNHLATLSLREANPLELVGGPFETAGHTAEVRHIDNGRGRYNIPHVGIFLWRLQAYEIQRGTARPAALVPDGRYTFHPLGLTMPLFNQPQAEAEIGDPAGEINVPGPLRRRVLHDELIARREQIKSSDTPDGDYFGSAPRVRVFADGEEVLPEELTICNLETWNRPQPLGFQRLDGAAYGIRAAVDPVLGRLAFAQAETPARVEVTYSYGFSGDIGGGPYSRRQAAGEVKAEAWVTQDTLEDPEAFERLLRVPGEFPDLASAVQAWVLADQPPAIIQIDDSRTYPGGLVLDLKGSDLLIQAADRQRPVVDGRIDVTDTSGGGRFGLSGLLVGGPLGVAGNLRALSLVHCALMPGVPLEGESLTVEPPADQLVMLVDSCICGGLNLPPTMARLAAYDSIVDAAPRDLPVLVSGSLAAFPTFDHTHPRLSVTLGGDGPYVAELPAPADLAAAATALETAIREAGPGPAFRGARVFTVDSPNRLVIVPGAPGSVSIGPAAPDTTSAGKLGLDEASARRATALVSGRVVSGGQLGAAAPALSIAMGSEALTDAALPAPVGTGTPLERAADRAQGAIRGAGGDAAFAETLVLPLRDRLLVVPGTPAARVRFGAAAADRVTVAELGLSEGRGTAIGSSVDAERFGPPAALERCTVFGQVRVTALDLASECIFMDPLTVERRQKGCARFSYVPAGSLTPRRFECQPDLAIATALAQRPGIPEGEAEQVRAAVTSRVAPTFSAARFAAPAYGQLAAPCAKEIRTGAEDGSEMGAFSMLKQPQREANLRAGLAEYLRFGLEAGVFYVDFVDNQGEGA